MAIQNSSHCSKKYKLKTGLIHILQGNWPIFKVVRSNIMREPSCNSKAFSTFVLKYFKILYIKLWTRILHFTHCQLSRYIHIRWQYLYFLMRSLETQTWFTKKHKKFWTKVGYLVPTLLILTGSLLYLKGLLIQVCFQPPIATGK